MATYQHSTIHSKLSKFKKTSKQTYGTLLRGSIARHRQPQQEQHHDLLQQMQSLPQSKKQARVLSKKQTPVVQLIESTVFPAIYFKKTTMRNILKQFVFPDEVQAIGGEDERVALIFQIVSNLLSQITFYIFNILIGQNKVSECYYVFFSDSQTIPYTKCCNAPLYVELSPNGSGRLLCNAAKCPHTSIAQFLLNFEDAAKLWRNVAYFAQATSQDKILKNNIAKIIASGKHKQTSLGGFVQQTSKAIAKLFYAKPKLRPDNVNQTAAFITNAQQTYTQHLDQDYFLDAILSPEETNIDMLKMKLEFINKKDKKVAIRAANQLVNQGKVFHKNFQIIKKIDQFMLTKKDQSINFSRMMEKMKRSSKLPKLNQTVIYRNGRSFN